MPCIGKLIRINLNSYFPGWDCHGLPIENKALQDLKVSPVLRLASSSQSPYRYNHFCFTQEDPHSLPASTIRDAARETAEREMKIQRAEFEKFGIMADWSKESTYRTLGNDFFRRSSSHSSLILFQTTSTRCGSFVFSRKWYPKVRSLMPHNSLSTCSWPLLSRSYLQRLSTCLLLALLTLRVGGS